MAAGFGWGHRESRWKARAIEYLEPRDKQPPHHHSSLGMFGHYSLLALAVIQTVWSPSTRGRAIRHNLPATLQLLRGGGENPDTIAMDLDLEPLPQMDSVDWSFRNTPQSSQLSAGQHENAMKLEDHDEEGEEEPLWLGPEPRSFVRGDDDDHPASEIMKIMPPKLIAATRPGEIRDVSLSRRLKLRPKAETTPESAKSIGRLREIWRLAFGEKKKSEQNVFKVLNGSMEAKWIRQHNKMIKKRMKDGTLDLPYRSSLPKGKWGRKKRMRLWRMKNKMPVGDEEDFEKELKRLLKKKKFKQFSETDLQKTHEEAYKHLTEDLLPLLQRLKKENKACGDDPEKLQALRYKRLMANAREYNETVHIFRKPETLEQVQRMKFLSVNLDDDWENVRPRVSVSKERVLEMLPKVRPPRFGVLTRQLYVRNVPFQTSENTLRQWFEQYGPIESMRMHRSELDKSFMGSVLVTYKNRSDAVGALRLSGHRVDGRLLRVQMIKPTKHVLAFNLSPHVDEKRLRSFFGSCGQVWSVSWIKERGNWTGNAVIEFSNTDEAYKAVMDKFGAVLAGKVMRLELMRLPRLSEERRVSNATSIIVGNLPKGTTEEEIRRAFDRNSSQGCIRGVTMMQKYTQEQGSTMAVVDFDQTETLVSTLQEKLTKRIRFGSRNARVAVGHPSLNVWIFNISEDITQAELMGFLNRSGAVASMEMKELNGTRKLAARAMMTDIRGAVRVVNRCGVYLRNSKLQIDFARPRLLPHYYSQPRRREAQLPLPALWTKMLGRKERVNIGYSKSQLRQPDLSGPEWNFTVGISSPRRTSMATKRNRTRVRSDDSPKPKRVYDTFRKKIRSLTPSTGSEATEDFDDVLNKMEDGNSNSKDNRGSEVSRLERSVVVSDRGADGLEKPVIEILP